MRLAPITAAVYISLWSTWTAIASDCGDFFSKLSLAVQPDYRISFIDIPTAVRRSFPGAVEYPQGYLKEIYEPYIQSLTRKDRALLALWTTRYSRKINQREKGKNTRAEAQLKAQQENLLRIISKAPALPPGYVFRGDMIESVRLEKFKPGEIYTRSGFASASVQVFSATGFLRIPEEGHTPVLWVLKIPNSGAHALRLQGINEESGEREVLFPLGTGFRILNSQPVLVNVLMGFATLNFYIIAAEIVAPELHLK